MKIQIADFVTKSSPLKERVTKAKLLQFVSGVNVSSFWLTSFIFDFGTYLLTALIILFTIVIFQEEGWSKLNELSPVFAVLALFGFSMLPMTFVSSLAFSIPSTGFVRMVIVYIFTGKLKLTHAGNFLKCILIIFFFSFKYFRHNRVLCHNGNVISGIQTFKHGQQNEMVLFNFSALFAE